MFYNHVYNVKTFSMETLVAILLDMMKVVCETTISGLIMMLQLKEENT